MGRPKRMRILSGILKDKLSLFKATILFSAKPTSSYHLAILRATTHHPPEPPPNYTLDDVLAIGHHHPANSSALIAALLRRLHRTHSAHVALKCLLTLHHILTRGSLALKHQTIAAAGPHLNLSTFRDGSDSDTWELSRWVRWYAEVLEQSLVVSRSLEFHLSPLTGQTQNRRGERISRASNVGLLMELSSLVAMVEQICRAPESLHYQRIDLIYEVMKLVGEDYRVTLREVFARITDIKEKTDDLGDDELIELLGDLKRLEDCKEKVVLMFLNKKRNDGAWDLIAQMRKDGERVKDRRESLRLVRFQGGGNGQLRASPAPGGKKWLDVDWNPLFVSVA